MKRLRLVFLLTCVVAGAQAQKAKVQTAYNYYKEPYQQYDKAMTAIDEAILHEQTAGMPKTWYYRGLIYQALYKSEKYGELCKNCLVTAYESFDRAQQLDPNNDWADEIKAVRIPMIANNIFDVASNAYKAKDFKTALENFEMVHKILPEDTAVILYTAYSAEGAEDYSKAKNYYEQLIRMKYADMSMYQNLSKIYATVDKDENKALSTIRDGRAIYPDSLNLLLAEINILLSSGRNEEASLALNVATEKDPNNDNLYLALGSTYDNLANPKDSEGKELPKPKAYEDYMKKAEESYLKGLQINPDNYIINYNLGALYFNQGAEMKNQANNLKSNDDYAKAKAKFDAKFQQAKPYLEKALEINPKTTEADMFTYEGTLNSLKQLYARTGETEKYERIKALLEKQQ